MDQRKSQIADNAMQLVESATKLIKLLVFSYGFDQFRSVREYQEFDQFSHTFDQLNCIVIDLRSVWSTSSRENLLYKQ